MSDNSLFLQKLRPHALTLSQMFLQRCDMVAGLTPGWCEGAGVAINLELLEDGKDIVASLVRDHGIPEPLLCPVEDGSVDLNWTDLGIFFTLHCPGHDSGKRFTFTKVCLGDHVGTEDPIIDLDEQPYISMADTVNLIVSHWDKYD